MDRTVEQEGLVFLLQRLWTFLNYRRKVQLGLFFILTIFASLAEVISIGAVLPFLSAMTAPEKIYNHHLMQPLNRLLSIDSPAELLFPLTIAFCVTIAVSGLMRLLLLWVQTRLTHSIGADFSLDIYKRTLYQPYAVHISRNSSELISGISNKANSIIYAALFPTLNIINSFLMIMMILVALIFINPVVAISSIFGFSLLYLSIIPLTKKKLAQSSARSSKESNNLIKALQEGLGGIRDVLIDGTQSTYCKIYRDADLPLRRAQSNIVIIGGIPRFGMESLGMILIAVLAYWQTAHGSKGGIAIPVLGALALGAQRTLPVLQQAYYSWTTMKGGQAYLKDTIDLLNQPLPVHAYIDDTEMLPFNRSISFNNVNFRYSNDSPVILERLNFEIKRGTKVGFIGTTGSGKSTTLDILMGLLWPTAGALKIDHIVIDSSNFRSWQKHIAHVPQVIYLADATIRENIAFGIPPEDIDDARVIDAARKAKIAETIDKWEKKYDTRVGERGVRLSGGQRQRIGIARALYKRADVIIFDEATSALDNETETEVMKAVDELETDLTIIIVAHRLSTLQNCSVIFQLEDGRLLRQGTYQQIIEAKNKT